ncbi:MAG TPA: sugar phosphate isomerase/epimerase [Planctomycetaceae bacterium]|nr:sugar phosphate isomerase/epimerase [Planctomycetaceae bacterium]
MQRRTFLATSSAAALAASIPSPTCEAAMRAAKRNGLGLQLWTVRNQMADDPKATLKAVADAGYKQVELMNVLESAEIIDIARDLGLKVRSAFINWESIGNSEGDGVPAFEEILEAAGKHGLEYLVFGYIGRQARDTGDKLRKIADATNKAAELTVKAEMKLSYHNHSFEFEKIDGDQTGFDIFIERFDDKLVNFEFDVFWAAIGGWDPIETMERLGDRLGQIHLKDIKKGQGVEYDEGKVPEDAFQEVGDGTIDMKKVIEVAAKYGVTQFHVEQDQSPDPLKSIVQSYQYTKKIW